MQIHAQGPRDPADLTDEDLATMSEAERAEYYYANRDRLDELFDGEPEEFVPAKGASTVISVRLQPGDLRVLEQAAALRNQKLSTFIREAAMTIANDPGAHVLTTDAELLYVSLRDVKESVTRLEILLDPGVVVEYRGAQSSGRKAEPNR